ncbi:hypothetical protein PX554_20515 [Sphingomonas sp. H39-1-10]|uniref:hypothetical protein n=1 Tax=Sphingomonas pollutisoli TaxID=3030829 RepID=UPI0023B9CE24|nr:hypothetical protein [Sphingomonas pollutisoli]MDF0490518.1 hypothetical protein [Sphingomonas pollutisoli]
MPSGARESLGTNADKLRAALELGCRLQFNFSGFFLIIGVMVRSASVAGLAIVVYNCASIEALLAGSLFLGRPTRRKLASFYCAGLGLPVVVVVWCLIEQMSHPIVPKWDWIASSAACAMGVNIYEAWSLARFRREGSRLVEAMAPVVRSTLPYSVAVLVAGFVTLGTHSVWVDVAIGVAIIAGHIEAVPLLRRLGAFDVAASGHGGSAAYQLLLSYPRLGVLTSSAWQEAVESVRRRSFFRALR